MIFRTEKQSDYFLMPRNVMRPELSYKARGVMGTMLSRPDNWDFSIEGLVALSVHDGRTVVSSALKELVNTGYVHKRYLRDAHGRVTKIEYIVSEIPVDDMLVPLIENCLNERNSFVRSALRAEIVRTARASVNPTAQACEEAPQPIPIEDVPEQPKVVQPKPKKPSKRKVQFATPAPVEVVAKGVIEPPTPTPKPPRNFLHEVRMNINYYSELLVSHAKDRPIIDNIVDIIAEIMARSDRERLIPICGVQYPVYLVQDKLNKLRSHHIEHVIAQLKSNYQRVRNPQGYVLSMLYNLATSYNLMETLDIGFICNPKPKPTQSHAYQRPFQHGYCPPYVPQYA